MFLALELELHSDDFPKALLLSPKVMRWADDLWLIDLTASQSYWKKCALHQEKQVEDIYKVILENSFGDEYRAALAENPWQALIMVDFMKERSLSGLVAKYREWGQKFYHNISWASFFSTALSGIKHFEELKFKGFKAKSFEKHLAQMKRAVNQLGIKNPWEFQGVGSYAIRRRYGSTVKQIWEQIYPSPKAPIIFCPWKSFDIIPEVMVTRALDYAMNDWKHLEELLKEDFDKLCQLDAYLAEHRIVSLEWCLTLHDASHLRVPVHFRQPHSLQSETHSHETALLQAYYNFSRIMSEQSKYFLEQTGNGNLSIVAWSLSVKEWLFTPPQTVELFDDHIYEENELYGLKNRLSSDLHRYRVGDDWSAEYSFLDYETNPKEKIEHDKSLTALALDRPLFLYRDLKPISIQRRDYKPLKFSERTMTHWWQDQGRSADDELSFNMDYYQYLDEKKRLLWVCRESTERWRIHGIFA